MPSADKRLSQGLPQHRQEKQQEQLSAVAEPADGDSIDSDSTRTWRGVNAWEVPEGERRSVAPPWWDGDQACSTAPYNLPVYDVARATPNASATSLRSNETNHSRRKHAERPQKVDSFKMRQILNRKATCGAALGHKARESGALPMRARGVASIRSLSCAYRLQSERGLGVRA